MEAIMLNVEKLRNPTNDNAQNVNLMHEAAEEIIRLREGLNRTNQELRAARLIVDKYMRAINILREL
ncbi:MAG: hypothetical protein A3F73_09335 [Gallionellales bacterium RIFCSPLOWO2_12_FULL_59_22]|nr:MAG: hypothetical protein A3H99_13130 [Gallionellales bacterium RIFCSPLOWO2_02_FULL_59_110]OGT14613.1 MAG: hypothetical protein A3F73_09335 [Gallionellales bacterium RIFCSPLOWO2_12_FULL_59_22]